MNSIAFAQKTLDQAFSLFNMVADGMTDEQYNYDPPGRANSPAKSHVHAMSSVDFFVNGLIKGGEKRWAAFSAQHGLPANPMEIWEQRGPISLEAMKEFTADVQKDVKEYVSSLSESDLDRELDTTFFGRQTVAFLLTLAANHTMGHCGDISAVKGMQNLKGMPF